MLDGGMLQRREGENKDSASVCACMKERVFVRVIRCEVLGAALCSLKGSGWCPAPCSSSTVLRVSHPLPPLSSHLSSPFPSSSTSSHIFSLLVPFSFPCSALYRAIPVLLQQTTALQRCC